MVWGGLGMVIAVLACGPARGGDPPSFFDALVTVSPGITREVDLLFDHVRASADRLSQASIRLQYPVMSWLQFSLEMPVAFRDPDSGPSSTSAGNLLLAGQAIVWMREELAEIDVGLELTLPTGGGSVLGGSTALRPFATAGRKVGPFDVLASASYQWGLEGPASGTDRLQVALAIGYPFSFVAPFTELTLLQPVRGVDDHRPQVAVLPGMEFFLPWDLSLSIGVQLPVGPARVFDQRVLGFLKWRF